MLCTKAEAKRHPDLCDRWINETIRDHSRLNGFRKSRLLLSFCSLRMLSVGSRDAQPTSRIRTSTRPRPDSAEIVPSPSLSIHVLWRQYYIQYISVLSMTLWLSFVMLCVSRGDACGQLRLDVEPGAVRPASWHSPPRSFSIRYLVHFA